MWLDHVVAHRAIDPSFDHVEKTVAGQLIHQIGLYLTEEEDL